MSDTVIALLAAIGLSAWIYKQMFHRTNSTQNSVIIAAVAGVGLFIIFRIILAFIFS